MGWAHCGTDSRGREIGYAIPATCDHPGCEAPIHRGLACKCGDMHGDGDGYCEGYFCAAHLFFHNMPHVRQPVCAECLAASESPAPPPGFNDSEGDEG